MGTKIPHRDSRGLADGLERVYWGRAALGGHRGFVGGHVRSAWVAFWISYDKTGGVSERVGGNTTVRKEGRHTSFDGSFLAIEGLCFRGEGNGSNYASTKVLWPYCGMK